MGSIEPTAANAVTPLTVIGDFASEVRRPGTGGGMLLSWDPEAGVEHDPARGLLGQAEAMALAQLLGRAPNHQPALSDGLNHLEPVQFTHRHGHHLGLRRGWTPIQADRAPACPR